MSRWFYHFANHCPVHCLNWSFRLLGVRMAFYTAWMFGKYQGLNSFPVPLHRFIFLMPSEPSSPRSSRSSHLFSNCYQNGRKNLERVFQFQLNLLTVLFWRASVYCCILIRHLLYHRYYHAMVLFSKEVYTQNRLWSSVSVASMLRIALNSKLNCETASFDCFLSF